MVAEAQAVHATHAASSPGGTCNSCQYFTSRLLPVAPPSQASKSGAAAPAATAADTAGAGAGAPNAAWLSGEEGEGAAPASLSSSSTMVWVWAHYSEGEGCQAACSYHQASRMHAHAQHATCFCMERRHMLADEPARAQLTFDSSKSMQLFCSPRAGPNCCLQPAVSLAHRTSQ